MSSMPENKINTPFLVSRIIDEKRDIRVYVAGIPKQGLTVTQTIRLITDLELAIS